MLRLARVPRARKLWIATLPLALCAVLCQASITAETFDAMVVGVSDGDTVTVLQPHVSSFARGQMWTPCGPGAERARRALRKIHLSC